MKSITLLLLTLSFIISIPSLAQKRNPSENITFFVTGKIRTGEKNNFLTLLKDLVEATKAGEKGTLDYECLLSKDSASFHFFERYADSPAAIQHMKTFREKFSQRFNTSAEVTGFTLGGKANAELLQMLGGAPAWIPLGGFSR